MSDTRRRTDAHTDPLVFDDFLTHLRRQGFDIGVDHYLRLQELLSKVGAECAPQDLKTILAPIFATNQAQQEQFHRAFDNYFSLFQTPVSTAPSDGELADSLPASAQTAAKARRRTKEC